MSKKNQRIREPKKSQKMYILIKIYIYIYFFIYDLTSHPAWRHKQYQQLTGFILHDIITPYFYFGHPIASK